MIDCSRWWGSANCIHSVHVWIETITPAIPLGPGILKRRGGGGGGGGGGEQIILGN